MPGLSKEKILGQFFSGEKIPSLLASLLQINDIRTAIDPMCGSGDMFKPFINTNIEFWGIEIDSEVANITQKKFDRISIFNHDAFDCDFLLKLIPEHGFDLVITNPPFVRRELLNPISSNGIHQDFNSIRKNIVALIDNVNYIDLQDKKSIKTTLTELSKYADLSILSWILCISLLRHGGQLALVVPTSWMTREYAKSLIKLMNKLFKIEYIIIDANRTWFEGAAQVQTSLIVARRKYPNVSYIHDTIKYVNLYQSSISETSLIGNIPTNINFYNYINSTQSLPKYFDVIALPQDGAGGSRTCAAFMELDSNSARLIIDQTIYFHVTESLDEALFITGLLNSKALEIANSAFQAEGALGRRHIHTLPATSLPQFNPLDEKHIELVILTQKVMSDIKENVPRDLLNPNSGSVSVRRTKIYKIIDTLPSYISFNEIALKILES